MKKLLEILSNSSFVYSSKIGVKHCGNTECSHITEAVNSGFAVLEEKVKGHPYKGVKITEAGRKELARLQALSPEPRPLTEKEMRMNELREKLKNGTITQAEAVEFLKLYHT